MSPLPARMPLKKEVVLNSVVEFLGIWAVRREASLSLSTKDGVTTIAFSHSLSTLPLLPSVAAAAVGQPGESGIVSGCPPSGCPPLGDPFSPQRQNS